MKKIFDGFALGVSMLSIFPFFKVHTFYKGINGWSAMFYPLIGLLLGLCVWGFGAVVSGVFPHTHAMLLSFACWVVLTGALHLDGLSDTLDGLFVAKDRALEVMKDSHVGGMGMLFSVVFLLLKASGVASLDSFVYIPLVMMFSRLGAVFAIYFFPYIGGGMGALLKEELSFKQVMLAFTMSLMVAVVFEGVLLFVACLLCVFVLGVLFVRRYGGLSGDIYGFIIEMSELLLLELLLVNMG